MKGYGWSAAWRLELSVRPARMTAKFRKHSTEECHVSTRAPHVHKLPGDDQVWNNRQTCREVKAGRNIRLELHASHKAKGSAVPFLSPLRIDSIGGQRLSSER